MQGVIYLFFNNVMATHLGNHLLFLFPGCQTRTYGGDSPRRPLAFPCFRGAKPELMVATHLGDDLFFLFPGCQTRTWGGDSPR